MYYSRIGRNKLTALTIESAYFDMANAQFCSNRRRTDGETQDFYYNNSPANGGNGGGPTGDVNVAYDLNTMSVSNPVFGKVITHEIGDSQNDCLLNRVIVEAIPFLEEHVSLAPYDYYSAGSDYPKMFLSLRNRGFSVIPTSYEKTIDLVEKNMAAKVSRPGTNPWRSIRQTPTATNVYDPGNNDYRTYTKDGADVQNVHESFVLLAPLHSKFRRCRLKYVCRYTAIIRAFTIEYQQLARRFG